ncbi:uncharacterized protein HaLaN_07869, partial [Haematococcus lacustris]
IAAVYVWNCTPPATSINQNPAIPSRHLPTPAPAVPSPKPSYEIADSPEVLAQLFGRNDAAFKPAPVPADTLFPIQPGHPHRPHWATVLASTMLSISDSYALPTTTSIVWCHYQPDSPSSLPSLLRNFRHNRRTNVFFIPKTMPVNTNSVYYAALTVPSAMGCPEMPLVVVEDDVAFASNFYNHLSNLHKSALALGARHTESISCMKDLYPGHTGFKACCTPLACIPAVRQRCLTTRTAKAPVSIWLRISPWHLGLQVRTLKAPGDGKSSTAGVHIARGRAQS